MNAKEPRVSIVIPVYNEEGNIKATLESLNNQTYDNIQVIVVNDGSNDDSLRIAEERLAEFDCDDLILENTTNLGQSFSRNRGAMHADGKYIVFHDADDLSTPDRLTKQVQFMEEHPSVGVVGGAYIYVNPNRNQCEVKVRPTDDESVRQGMARECMINLGTAMFRREALFNTNLFESTISEGYELAINVGKEWSYANIKDPIYMYCINEGSISQKNQLRKKAVIMYRSFQAMKKLGLSYWYLPLQLGWLIYMAAPDKGKALIRSLISPTKDRSLSEEEKQTIQQLEEYR